MITFTMKDEALTELSQSTHVGRTHPTTLARMPSQSETTGQDLRGVDGWKWLGRRTSQVMGPCMAAWPALLASCRSLPLLESSRICLIMIHDDSCFRPLVLAIFTSPSKIELDFGTMYRFLRRGHHDKTA